MSLTVIKLGSSVIAEPNGQLRGESLQVLCSAIARAVKANDQIVLVSSGAIAVGVAALKLAERPTSIEKLQAVSAVGQGKLFRYWDDLLAEHFLTAAQVLLTMHDLGEREGFVNARNTLQTLLELGAIPIINENDTTTTEEISFGDNDLLAAQIAMLLGADRLLLMTSTDGLFTGDPTRDADAQLVAEINDAQSAFVEFAIGDSTSHHGTGGMRSKALAAQMATAAGIETVICSGLRTDAIRRVVAGELEGTRFTASRSEHSSFDLWLRYAKPTSGKIFVDQGAAKALTGGGTSLLPVGVTSVEGNFLAGDSVEICLGEKILAHGLTGYSSSDLASVVGLRSDQAQAKLPGFPAEAIHRDRLVLIDLESLAGADRLQRC